MTSPTIDDQPAQRALVGVAVTGLYAAQLADVHGVRREHFSDPTLGRLFAAAVERVDEETLEERIVALAVMAAPVAVKWITDLVDEPRKCMRDESGHYARRVLAAAERRARLHEHLAGLEALGIEVEVAA